MAYVIFDLDGTVIDSRHRQATRADGSLDLEHWFENARPHLIAQDSLLPLARSMKAIKRAGHHVIICTARCLQPADYVFLADNGLEYDTMLSRAHEGFCPTTNAPLNCDMRSDHDMKEAMLEAWFRGRGYFCAGDAPVIMFDDNLKVVSRMNEIGITCLNAVSVNRNMRAA